MEHVALATLLSCLEYGTNIHISVVFRKNYGNEKTALPREKTVHDKPFCRHMKSTAAGLERCYRCRNTALKKAIDERRPFSGLCVNGVYEYCHPVIYKEDVAAVIFVGNILPKAPTPGQTPFLDSFEAEPPEGHGRQLCAIIDAHIKTLLDAYPHPQETLSPLITNIKNYIEEGLCSDISVRHIATAFNYNESYIGRLFKQHTGMAIKEYINERRLKKARELLLSGTQSVTAIAAGCGFNNVTYFNRLFKARYGTAPLAYRKQGGVLPQ